MRSKNATWFETKIKYQKAQEDGSEKIVSEAYVVDALSFTEAESVIIDEMSVYVSGEFKVSGITKASYKDVFFSEDANDDKWYKVKLQFITIDEKTEKEKRTNILYLVQAKSLARSLRYIDEEMGKGMSDYEIVAINETKIMDVFEHKYSSKQSNSENEANDVPEYEQQEASAE